MIFLGGTISDWIMILLETGILVVLIKEYFFDKQQVEKRKVNKTLKKKKKTVIVNIENGVGKIEYKPNDIDVIINTKGEK